MKHLVIVRGAGDLATGTIVRLVHAGFRVIALETARPTAIRRAVALSEAVYEGRARVEDVGAHLAAGADEAPALASDRLVPVVVDPEGATIAALHPFAVVDAIIAKRNLGTRRGMAEVVVALGPGFTAGVDVDAVVETSRGHDLGRVILVGEAAADTGVPGAIDGVTSQRVLHAPVPGRFVAVCAIGDRVAAGQLVARIEGGPPAGIHAAIGGVVRGLLRSGHEVPAGFKVGDIDPRGKREHCFTISDKARAIGGGVLEALLMLGGLPGG